MSDIERQPILQELERFAQELPKEQRARLVKTATAFLNVGAMHGAFAGLSGGTSEGDKQEEFLNYLYGKQEEYEKQAKE